MAATRAALYLRTSTLSDHNSDQQLHDLRQMASERRFSVVREYADHISGAKAKHPHLDQLISDARRGQFYVVIVGALSDFPSVRKCLAVLDEVSRLGIGFVCSQPEIDTTDANMGQAMGVIVRGLVNLERNVRIANVKAGMRRSKLEGVLLGRKPLDVNRAEIVNDRAFGLSLTDVAKKHGVSRGTVCRLVKIAGVRAANLTSVRKVPPPSLTRHPPYPTFEVPSVPAMLRCASAESSS